MDLYRLLPGIIREMDQRASGATGPESDDAFWKRVFWCIEQEAGELADLVRGLLDLINASECPAYAIPLLGNFLGSILDSDWPEERKRLVLRSAILLFQHSGQTSSWKAYLGLLGHSKCGPVELYKEQMSEDFNYYEDSGGEYYGTLHAARIRVKEDGAGIVPLTEGERQHLEAIRPVHVLIDIEGSVVLDETDEARSLASEGVQPQATLVIVDQISPASDEVMEPIVECMRQCEYCETG